jgi:hypothetical protein
MAKATRKRNVSKVWNPSLPATLGNPKKGRKKVANAKTSRRNPQKSTAAKRAQPNPSKHKAKRGGHRAKHTSGRSTKSHRNPATSGRASLMRMKNPVSGANISVGGILGTVVVLGLANNFVNKATANQSPVVSAGIKIGAGFGLAKWGKKLPLLGNYAGLAGLVLIILGGQDLFNMYAAPYLSGVPVVGQFFGTAAPMTPLTTQPSNNGVSGIVNIPYGSPLRAGMRGIVSVDESSPLAAYMVQ